MAVVLPEKHFTLSKGQKRAERFHKLCFEGSSCLWCGVIWGEVGREVKQQSATAIIRDVSCNQADSSAGSYSIHISHSLPPQE